MISVTEPGWRTEGAIVNVSIQYFVLDGDEVKPLSLRKHHLMYARKEAFVTDRCYRAIR